MVRLPAFDIYAELGIATTADRAGIRAAYRRAAKEAHPDVSDASAAPGATARMARINAARDVLLDPHRRAEYDLQHGLLARRFGEAAPSPGRTTRAAGRTALTARSRRRAAPGEAGPETATGEAEAEPPSAARSRRGPPTGEAVEGLPDAVRDRGLTSW